MTLKLKFKEKICNNTLEKIQHKRFWKSFIWYQNMGDPKENRYFCVDVTVLQGFI